MSLQLTISLLASNRPESLERCLDSLKPLLIQIPSELIIVSTGDDERVQRIAGLYTEQMIPFHWCNDFSQARNAGLKQAKGEWFLFIDDDEWFEDVTEICRFFTSGEYQKFNSASYKVRNYLDWTGTRYSDFHVLRMARIVPESHFENPIHEDLVPAGEPRKYFDAYVHHYGYVKDISKTEAGKTSRNIPLLLQTIEKNPSEEKSYLQLVQEYIALKNWKKAEEYCRKARDICQKQSAADAYKYWLEVYLIRILFGKGDLYSAEKEALSILEKENPCTLVRLIIYNYLTTIYYEQGGKAFDTLKFGLQFEQLLTYMDEHPSLWEEQQYADLNEQTVKAQDRLLSARLLCLESALELGDSKKAKYFLELLPWEEEYQIQQYYPLFDKWKEEYKNIFKNILKTLPRKCPYLMLQEALGLSDYTKRYAIFLQCVKDTKGSYLQIQIIKEAIQTKMQLCGIAGILDLETWKQCTEIAIKEISDSDTDKVIQAAKILKTEFPLYGLWLVKLELEKRLTQGRFMLHDFLGDFEEYCSTVISFYKMQYQDSMFEDSTQNCLPSDYKFAFYALQGIEKIQTNEFSKSVQMFGSAIQYKPTMMAVINEILRFIKNKMSKPAQNTTEEFQRLAIQMKSALLQMTENGQYTEAISVLSQLLPLLPDDLELLRMKQKILRSM